MSFGLKNDGATFQWSMLYAFHNIKHIAKAYLHDFFAHSKKGEEHCVNLRDIFKRCCFYKIRLNLHKCFFGVIYGQ